MIWSDARWRGSAIPAPLDCPDWIVRATWSRPCPGNGVSARCGIGTPEWFDGCWHKTWNEAQDNYLTAPCANVPGALGPRRWALSRKVPVYGSAGTICGLSIEIPTWPVP